MDKTVDFKNKVVKTLTGGVAGLLKANKVTIFNGLGQVNPDKTVVIGDKVIKGRRLFLQQVRKYHASTSQVLILSWY